MGQGCRYLAIALVALALGCGGKTGATQPGVDTIKEAGAVVDEIAIAETGAAIDSAIPSDVRRIIVSETADEGGTVVDAGVASEASDAPELGVTCDVADRLAKLIQPVGDASTLVVRVDFVSLQIIGWHYFPEPPMPPPTEAEARQVATADTGYDMSPSTAAVVSGYLPHDDFVFFDDPSDNGAGAAVSIQTGRTVFGGTFLWLGRGRTTYPKIWSPPEDLGIGCAMVLPAKNARGLVLDFDAVALDDQELLTVLQVVGKTNISAAMALSRQVSTSAMVLRLPRRAGDPSFTPRGNEWVVILHLVRA